MAQRYFRKKLNLDLSKKPTQLKGVSSPIGKTVHFVRLLKEGRRKLYICVASPMENILEANDADVKVYARPLTPYRSGTLIMQEAEKVKDVWVEMDKGVYIVFSLREGEAQLYFPTEKPKKPSNPFLLIKRELFNFEDGLYDLESVTFPKLEEVLR